MKKETRKAIYVLDTNEEFCEYLRDSFEKMKVHGEIFSDARQFYRALNHSPPTVALVDLDFNGYAEGFKVIQHVRDHISKDLVVFALSEHNDERTIDHALDLGCHDFIFKPLDKLVLISKLCVYLNIEVKEEWELSNIVTPFLRSEPVELSFRVEVKGIDERGIWFETNHLIVDGTVASIDCPKIKKILQMDEPILVTVNESKSADKDGNIINYGEFTTENSVLSSSIRSWISNQNSRLP